MTWTPPERTADAAAIHAAAEADRRTNPELYSLDPDDVLTRVLERTDGSTEAFLPGWRDGLEQFLGSLAEDGRLNALGARTMSEQATAKLVSAHRVARAIEADATYADDLIPPIVIVGGWRTGTTFLFRLMARDPRLRAPLPVDLTRPWRVAGLDAAAREELLSRMDAAPSPLHVLNPDLRRVHDHGPRLPEECVLALGADLRSWGFSSTARLESYSRWLAQQDLGPSYREYRRVLALLDDHDGRRFVLKSPAHLAEPAALVDTFPGAVVVNLHRDVVETVASGASLFSVFRSTYSDEVDPFDVGRFQTDQTELWMRRAVEHRSVHDPANATFVDLAYRDLVASPVEALRRVYRAAGMEPPDDLPGFVEAHHRASPRNEHGAHRYAPEDFGLAPAELRERFAGLAPSMD